MFPFICFKILPANGCRTRYYSRVAFLEDVIAQQSFSSWPAEWAHCLQFIPGRVDQQFLGLLRICVGVVEENKSIFCQDSITHFPSVLGTVAFVLFLWFAERGNEQCSPSYAIHIWCDTFFSPVSTETGEDCTSQFIKIFHLNTVFISSCHYVNSRGLLRESNEITDVESFRNYQR